MCFCAVFNWLGFRNEIDFNLGDPWHSVGISWQLGVKYNSCSTARLRRSGYTRKFIRFLPPETNEFWEKLATIYYQGHHLVGETLLSNNIMLKKVITETILDGVLEWAN